MKSGNFPFVDRTVVVALLSALLACALVLLTMSLASMGSDAGWAPSDTSVRVGPVVLGANGSIGSCEGECSGGLGGDSIGGGGGTNFGGSSVPGSSGLAGTPGTQGLLDSQGTPGTSDTGGGEASSFQQSSFTESSDSNDDEDRESQSASASPDQFLPVDPESSKLPPPLPSPPACALGDLLGLGSLLAPLADILRLLKLC